LNYEANEINESTGSVNAAVGDTAAARMVYSGVYTAAAKTINRW